MDTETFHLLTITTKHGDSHELYRTKDDAKQGVYDFVATYWQQDGPAEPLPTDRDTAITAYFKKNNGDEDWNIQELPIEGPAVRATMRTLMPEWTERWSVWPHCNGQAGCWMHTHGRWCKCTCRWCRIARRLRFWENAEPRRS